MFSGQMARAASLIALTFALGMIGGCKPTSDATLAPEVDPGTINPDSVLISDIEGVWATTDGSGTDGNETVFMIAGVYDDVVQITRDGIAQDLVTEDIDPAQSTATFRYRSDENGVKSRENKRITFGKVATPGVKNGGFTLRVTYPDGKSQDLSFVRRPSKQDYAEMERAFDGPGMLPDPKKPAISGYRIKCADAVDFRGRTVCKDEALRELDLKLAEQFEYLDCWKIDAQSTRKAAYKQLDACTDTLCLTKAYTEWTQYMDKNYDIGDVVCEEGDYQ